MNKVADLVGADPFPAEEPQASLDREDAGPDYSVAPPKPPKEYYWILTGTHMLVSNDEAKKHDIQPHLNDSMPNASGTVEVLNRWDATWRVNHSNMSLNLVEKKIRKYCRDQGWAFAGILKSDGSVSESFKTSNQSWPYHQDWVSEDPCYEVVNAMQKQHPEIQFVAGNYIHPEFGPELHAWGKLPDGTIIDPTHAQFDEAKPYTVVRPGEKLYNRYQSWQEAPNHPIDDYFTSGELDPRDDPLYSLLRGHPNENKIKQQALRNLEHFSSIRTGAYMYHVAPARKREQYETMGPRNIFLWNNGQIAQDWANAESNSGREGRPPELHDIWLVKTDGLNLVPDPGHPGSAFTTRDPISPDRIHRMSAVKIADYPGMGPNLPQPKDWRNKEWSLDIMPPDAKYFNISDPMDIDEPQGPQICPHCHELFNDWGDLVVHERRVHDEYDEPSTEWEPVIDYDQPIPADLNEGVMDQVNQRQASEDDFDADRLPILVFPDGAFKVGPSYSSHEDLLQQMGYDINNLDQMRETAPFQGQLNFMNIGGGDIDYHLLPPRIVSQIPNWQSIEPRIEQTCLNVLRDEGWKIGKYTHNARLAADQIPPVGRMPFIFDVKKDRIFVGQPGDTQHDLHGGRKLTPGGLVSGDYTEKGHIEIQNDTTMPYTIRHLAQLWYSMHPELKVKSIYKIDDKKRRKVATLDNIGPKVLQSAQGDMAAQEAFHALRQAGGNVYVVGGAVRDTVLGRVPKDIDLMAQGLPENIVLRTLRRLPGSTAYTGATEDTQTDQKGKAFGVFLYKAENGDEVEIALPRAEEEGANLNDAANVRVDPNLPVEEDLGRRDFTGNAMAVNMDTGQLHMAPGTNGVEDLNNGQLRVVREKSFHEDPIRMLRAFSSMSKHGLNPTPDTSEMIERNSHRLGDVPSGRLGLELRKILSGDQPAKAFRHMWDTGAMNHVIPELMATYHFDQKNKHHRKVLHDHLLEVLDKVAAQTKDPDERMAALLHDIGKPASAWYDEDGNGHYYHNFKRDVGGDHWTVGATMAKNILDRIKWNGSAPNEQGGRSDGQDRIKFIQHIIQHHMYDAPKDARDVTKFLKRINPNPHDPQLGYTYARPLMRLRRADQEGKGTDEWENAFPVSEQENLVNQAEQAGNATTLKDLAINGRDLMQLGIPAGPMYKQILDNLLESVIENPELNNKETLTQMAQQMSQQKTSMAFDDNIWYHITHPDRLNSIAENGLVPNTTGMWEGVNSHPADNPIYVHPNGVYMWPTYEAAGRYSPPGGGHYPVLQIRGLDPNNISPDHEAFSSYVQRIQRKLRKGLLLDELEQKVSDAASRYFQETEYMQSGYRGDLSEYPLHEIEGIEGADDIGILDNLDSGTRNQIARLLADGSGINSAVMHHGPISPEKIHEVTFPSYDVGNHTVPHKTRPLKPMAFANILDSIQDKLDEAVFDDPGSPNPKVKPNINKWLHRHIFRVMKDAGWPDPSKYVSLVLTGSLTTYQWSHSSDLDIALWIDTHIMPEWQRADLVSLIVKQMDGAVVPGTTHPIQVFVVDPLISPQDLYKPGLRSAYDLEKNKWLVPPERQRTVDVRKAYPALVQFAKMNEDKMRLLLKYDPPGAKEFWRYLHERRHRDMARGKGDYSESNIIYKWLMNSGLAPIIESVTGIHIAMAERSGDPQLDALIDEFKGGTYNLDPNSSDEWKGFKVEDLRNPAQAWSRCDLLANQFAEFCQQHGIKANANENHYRALGYDDAKSQGGMFLHHCTTEVFTDTGTYNVDWTASQYGYKEFPMVQKLNDNKWQREWTGRTAAGQVMYHVAPTEERQAILAHGLDSNIGKSPWGDDPGGGTFMWRNLEDAEEYVHTIGEPETQWDIWQINTSGLSLKPDPQSPEPPRDIYPIEYASMYTQEIISPNRLKLIDTINSEDWEDRYSKWTSAVT